MPTHVAPHVAVLVLGYNDRENLAVTLASASKQTYTNYQLFFIDNASQDGSLEYVAHTFPKITCLPQTKNTGYAGAYARVLRQIFKQNFDAAVLLNPDVRVDRNWLKELTASAYQDPTIGFAQPKIFLWDDKQDQANTFGNEIHYLGFGFCGHYGKTDSLEYEEDRPITYASGASLFVKREAYLQIGGIDKDFFCYLEDQDLVWRGHLFGWKSVLSARSFMWHQYVFKDPSRSRWKFEIYERNRFYFILKNYSLKLILLISPMFILMELGMLGNALFQGYFWDKLKAYRGVSKHAPALIKKRTWIQKHRRVSDRSLIRLLRSEIVFKELESPFLGVANTISRVYYKFIQVML